MELIDYSEKSFVAYGEETRNITQKLKELGGRFNPNLTHPQTGMRFAGWIFSKKQKEAVSSLTTQVGHGSSGHGSSGHGSSGHGSAHNTTAHSEADLIIQEIVDPIQRLGLQDNGPDPVKKTKAKPITRSKTLHEQFSGVGSGPVNSGPVSSGPVSSGPVSSGPVSSGSGNLFPSKDVLFDEIQEIVDQPPEIQEISFSMIVPKVGMKVKMTFGNQTVILKIVEVIPNEEGWKLEFIASKDGYQSYRFVMVGKKWRLLTTEVPHYLNFL